MGLYLFALADEGLLALDHRVSRWSWDLGRIHAKGYRANVADLMVAKLSRLPARTQEALQHLACLGNSADLTTLALVRRTLLSGCPAFVLSPFKNGS